MNKPEKVESEAQKRSKIFERLNRSIIEDTTTSADLMPNIRRGTKRLQQMATHAIVLDPQDMLSDLKRSLKF